MLNLEDCVKYPKNAKHCCKYDTPNILTVTSIHVKPKYRNNLLYPWAGDWIFIIIKFLYSVQFGKGFTSPKNWIEIYSPTM